MATTNKLGNVQHSVDTFYHSLEIEETRSGGLIVHNNKNGEGFSINGNALKGLIANSGIDALKTLICLFGLNVPKLQEGLSESIYSTIEHIHTSLKRVFVLNNHSDVCLLTESLTYAR
ncbi:hypothetical protein [Vibrio sp. D431a]|uniref:hypothetical protein n=1 Tax=Vibrio sp. D431a TaxID=2837388 RepID=UPI002553FE58|nr:hypothetical protein [Vibrio sp. D431a]MDK9793305.1 hypothetical protein [Vibrio sp. D431a]